MDTNCCDKCVHTRPDPDKGRYQGWCKDKDCACHSTPQGGESERKLENVASNIVYQLGDLLYGALPPDVAHEHFVMARQNTNDKAIDFAKKLIANTIAAAREAERAKTALEAIEVLHLYAMKTTDTRTLDLIEQIQRHILIFSAPTN